MMALLRPGLVLVSCASILACGGEPAENPVVANETAARTNESGTTFERAAGSWEVRAWNLSGDSLPGFTLVAGRDTSNWSLNLEERSGIPVRVIAASGDLFVVETAPYESVLRPNVSVVLHLENQIQGDRLTGNLLALYDVSGAGAVLRGRLEGTRTR